MQRRLLNGLAAGLIVGGIGVMSTSFTAVAEDGADIRGRGNGFPSLGSGCNTQCSGAPFPTPCILCSNPGADVLSFQSGTGWTW